MEKKIYEYLRDVLCPKGGRGTVHYSGIQEVLGIEPLEIIQLLRNLERDGRISVGISTYAAHVVLK